MHRAPVGSRDRKLQAVGAWQRRGHVPELDVLEGCELPRNLAEDVVVNVPCLFKWPAGGGAGGGSGEGRGGGEKLRERGADEAREGEESDTCIEGRIDRWTGINRDG